MTTCLVTGSAGFVGSHFVDYILENTNWNIVGLDSFKHRGDALRVQSSERYKIYCCDLSSPISHRMKAQIGTVDYIVNFASESHVDRSIIDPVPFVQNNVNLALHMLEYAREVKPKVFIQISTDEVYGAALPGMKHKEWSEILPSNCYAASKAAQEAIAISYWRTYGVPLIITNTMNLVGNRQDPEKFVPMCIKKIMAGEELTIHGTEEFIGSRSYIHATNMADAIFWILNNVNPEIYEHGISEIKKPVRLNIVGEKEMNNLELAEKIAEIIGKPLKYRLVDFHSARPGHDAVYQLDGEKMSSLGWSHPVPFEESLREIVSWTVQHPEWLL